MFKIDITFEGKKQTDVFLRNDNVEISGKIDLPYAAHLEKDHLVLIAGSIKCYNGESVELNMAAKMLLNNEVQETDFYGDFICLAFSRDCVEIYTDPFGQFPVYYVINNNGSIVLASGKDCKGLSRSDNNIDIDFLSSYINSGDFIENRTAIAGMHILSPGFKYCFTSTGGLSREYIINKIISKAENINPYTILKKTLEQKITAHDKIVLELSGGVESSSIAAILACHKNNKDIKFLTYYDKYSLSSNELSHAKKVAKYFNVKLDVIELSDKLPFTPFTEEIPFHPLPGSYACFYNQQRYMADSYDASTLFINGHGGDSIYLAPSPPALFAETLFNSGVSKAFKILYSISLQHHSSLFDEAVKSMTNEYILKNNPQLWYFDSIKNINRYTRPASVFWWQALGSTISEVLPILNHAFSGKTVYYPFLSSPVVINAIRTGFDKLVHNEFNRFPLRKSVYINTGFRGIWRTDKGDTTYNMLAGISKNYHFIRNFLLSGHLAEKKLLDRNLTENILKKLNLGLPEGLPVIVRLYAAETCLRSLDKGGL